MIYSRIIATGGYLPDKILTNDDLSKLVDTNDEWIVTRTGIHQRHIASDDQATSDLAVAAARQAFESGDIDPQSIDLIIVASTTPDMVFPSTACIVQEKLGITNECAAFDVQAVCSGFIYALATADSMIKNGIARRALVIGAEVMSRIVNWQDRSTCILFGDGAGAIVLEASPTAGILSSRLRAKGQYRHVLSAPAQIRHNAVAGCGFISMEGSTVFRFAVRVMAEAVLEALEANGLKTQDIDWLVPHQANYRIMDATAKKLEVPDAKVINTVGGQANTSAASIPLAIREGATSGRFKKGQLIALTAVGGGLAWGATLLRW
ncbi:MAG: ketoacyl-ACP synthase III [Burkholderiales bacterium]|jgi:3-oxoacyl-[acyl-carrier-protein] synthase-3|nr:ketoacyl-ACP synthase III [Burkholderiales bacterium]